MSFAERIRMKRRSNGLTQIELSELIGVSPMSVRRWESGERVPNAGMIPKLAEVLKTSVLYLMGSEDINIDQETQIEKDLPCMAYWGGVVDNAKRLAINGDDEEKNDVLRMLKRACNFLSSA